MSAEETLRESSDFLDRDEIFVKLILPRLTDELSSIQTGTSASIQGKWSPSVHSKHPKIQWKNRMFGRKDTETIDLSSSSTEKLFLSVRN